MQPVTLIHSWQQQSRDWCVYSKMAGCCFLSDKGNEILLRINISLPLTTITGLEGAGQWLGLPGHRTSHQWSSAYEATLKPWFTHGQLILKRILLSILLRQQDPGIIEHTSVCTASSGVYWGWWPYDWTSVLNWYEILFFSFWILKWFCLISILSQTQFDGP
jgi:hypothetical protein